MRIEELSKPDQAAAELHPWLLGVIDVDRVVGMERLGHADFAFSEQSLPPYLRGSDARTNLAWVAISETADPEHPSQDDVLGVALTGLPLKEDLAKAWVEIFVRPEARRQGIGSALLGVTLDAAREAGREVAMGQSFTPIPEPGQEVVVPPNNEGSIPADHPTITWLQRAGWSLEQCEVPSKLAITHEVLTLARTLRDQLRDQVANYDVVSWVGRTPEQYEATVCLGLNRMSTDAPHADLQLDEQHWDAERLREAEDLTVESGMQTAYSLVLLNGAPAAFSCLRWHEETPQGAWQEETLVLKEHRGKRLGMLVKVANLLNLVEANPEAARIHTWNAVENPWMLAINQELGFKPTGVEGAWRLRLDSANRVDAE